MGAADIPVEDSQLVATPRGVSEAVSVVEEVDGYSKAVMGIKIEAVRTGLGFGPNVVRATQGEGFVATSVTVQFPMLTWTTIGDDRVLAACITSAPPGSRWCEIDLQPGTVLIYAPGAEHTAVNPAGVSFTFAIAKQHELGELAQQLGLGFKPPPRGQVHALEPSVKSNALSSRLSSLVDAAVAGVPPQHNREDDILHAMTAALSEDRRSRRVGARRKIDNRHIAATCIEYAEAIERIPTIRELCLVAHVSERRLRTAFNETYSVPPAHFFRIWGLDTARRRLLAADRHHETVTRIALDLGFAHLSKFAGRYRRLHGESPSTTLATPV